jgi:hypothetical protein
LQSLEPPPEIAFKVLGLIEVSASGWPGIAAVALVVFLKVVSMRR